MRLDRGRLEALRAAELAVMAVIQDMELRLTVERDFAPLVREFRRRQPDWPDPDRYEDQWRRLVLSGYWPVTRSQVRLYLLHMEALAALERARTVGAELRSS